MIFGNEEQLLSGLFKMYPKMKALEEQNFEYVGHLPTDTAIPSKIS